MKGDDLLDSSVIETCLPALCLAHDKYLSFPREIWGSRSSVDQDSIRLGHDAVYIAVHFPAFQWSLLGTSTGYCLTWNVCKLFLDSSETLLSPYVTVYMGSYPRRLEILFSEFRSLFQDPLGLDSPGNSCSPVSFRWNLMGEEVEKGEGNWRLRIWGQYLFYGTRCRWKIRQR
jgi:hypothetical protein